MPYKTPEQRREASRRSMERLRGVNNGVNIEEGLTPGVNKLPPTWEYINKHGLETVQAIVTSLGKYADDVWLGNVSAKQIRDVIGEGPPLTMRKGGIV